MGTVDEFNELWIVNIYKFLVISQLNIFLLRLVFKVETCAFTFRLVIKLWNSVGLFTEFCRLHTFLINPRHINYASD